MPAGLAPILVLIAVVIIYVIAKVVYYSRKSEEQWEQVDKSKIRKWEDDDWHNDDWHNDDLPHN